MGKRRSGALEIKVRKIWKFFFHSQIVEDMNRLTEETVAGRRAWKYISNSAYSVNWKLTPMDRSADYILKYTKPGFSQKRYIMRAVAFDFGLTARGRSFKKLLAAVEDVAVAYKP